MFTVCLHFRLPYGTRQINGYGGWVVNELPIKSTGNL